MIHCPVPTLISDGHVPSRAIPVLTPEHTHSPKLGQPRALCPNLPAGEQHLGEDRGDRAPHVPVGGLSTAVPRADPHTEPGEGWERGTRGPAQAWSTRAAPARGAPAALQALSAAGLGAKAAPAPLVRCRNIYLILQLCFQHD